VHTIFEYLIKKKQSMLVNNTNILP